MGVRTELLPTQCDCITIYIRLSLLYQHYKLQDNTGQNYYLHNVIVFIYQVESVISTLLLYNVW